MPLKPTRLARVCAAGAFSTISFIVGAVTSILSGYLGMMIATYANARTALEARKGVAPAFMAGEPASSSSPGILPPVAGGKCSLQPPPRGSRPATEALPQKRHRAA